MTLTPNFLPVGSIVNKNGTPHIITAENIKLCEFAPRSFNLEFEPISLTPEILTEWCNMKRTENVDFILGNFTVVACGIRLPQDEWEYRYKDTVIEYLHELQMAYLVHMKTVLPIQIK